MIKLSETHVVDHIPLCVSAGPVEGGQEGLQMLGVVVLGVEQEQRQQLRRSDPCGH